MCGTTRTPVPLREGKGRKFALRFTGDRKRLRLDFNKQAQEALGLCFGLEVVVSSTPDGGLLLQRADAVRFGDPEMSGKIAALRAAQRAHGRKEVESWNLLLKTALRLGLGTAPDHVMIPTALAADFAWWLRQKMARERRPVQRRIAAEVLGVGGAAEAPGAVHGRPPRLRRKA